MDRAGASLDARRRPDLAAAAPRHLFNRRHRAADSRPEERQPPGARPREAGGGGRRGHSRRRRLEGPRGCRAHLGARRRHRRLAAHQPQARRRALGARPGRNAAGAAPQRPAGSHRRAGRRPDEDRPRCRHRRAARRRGVRLCHGAACRVGLRDDARVPPEHVPCGHRDAGPRAAQEVQRQARVRGDVLQVHRGRSPRADGLARVQVDGGDDRPRRQARPAPRARPLESARSRSRRRSSTIRRRLPGIPAARPSLRITASTGRSTTSSSSCAARRSRAAAARTFACRFATSIARWGRCLATR